MESRQERSHSNWATIILWLVANVLGFGFAGAFLHNFPLNYAPSLYTFRTPFDLTPGVTGFIFGFIPALLIGWPQRWILRRIWPISRWWIISVSLGMGVMHFLADGYVYAGDGSGFVLIGGLIVGVIQWRLLRPHVPASHWWGLAGAGGWVLGWVIGIGILHAIGYADDGRGNALGHGLVGGMAAPAYSLGTGLILKRAPE